MEPQHHPDPSTMLSYAAGSVTEGFSLVLAAHIENCWLCQKALVEAEDLGGDLLSSIPPSVMAVDDLTGVWAIIANEPLPAQVPRTRAIVKNLPSVLATFFPDGLEGVRWKTLVPGIRQHLLDSVDSGQGSVRMLHLAPGTRIPHHTHLGSELTLILKGSYSDETGHFRCGDLAEADSEIQHQPVVDSTDPCICLIATDQKLKFSGALNRMLQPLIGI